MPAPIFPAKEVKPLREAQGLTQEQFAEQLGVSRVLVTHWETGRQIPRGPAAILLAQLKGRLALAKEAS